MRETRYLIWLVGLLAAVLGVIAVPGFVAQPESSRAVADSSAEPGTASTDVAGGQNLQIEGICAAIHKGDFAGARQLLGPSPESKNVAITELVGIVSEYEAIEQRRQEAREAAHQEQLTELEKFRAKPDINEVNDIPEVFSIVVRASEFANKQQREQLRSDPFMKRVIEKATARAAEFEADGKWLDAYTTCNYWLQAIDPNNEAYSDRAEQLLDKANIVASFQDSPCETRQERYGGVGKEMFARAIDALKFNYVSIIDYRQMATEAVKRCDLLGQVLRLSFSDISKSFTSGSSGETLLQPDSRQQAAWSAALAALLDEVEKSPTGISKDGFMDMFEKVLALNTTTIRMPEQVLIAQFAEAALAALDPYTVMVWPQQVETFEKMMTNEFTGIGVEITRRKGLLTVGSLLPDTPAYNSDLDAGDVIAAVDGVETKEMSLGCAVRFITGPAGTNVRLTIERPGEEKSRDITITRAKIVVPTIRGWQRTNAGKWLYMIDDVNRIGYVRIMGFSAETAGHLDKVLTELEAAGLKGLILDLRFNSGGLLDSATAVADQFISEGLIVSTRPRVLWTYISAHEEGTHPANPMVILINSSSASASEIVAGSLQDPKHNRAVLVGERTHGKGSVQGITHYPGGGAQLKYTMAYYHLPSGQRVESREAMEKAGRTDWGIGPDVAIELRTDELRKLLELRRDNDVLVKAGHEDNGTALKRHTAEETLEADPQLAVGVLVVRSQLVQAGVSAAKAG